MANEIKVTELDYGTQYTVVVEDKALFDEFQKLEAMTYYNTWTFNNNYAKLRKTNEGLPEYVDSWYTDYDTNSLCVTVENNRALEIVRTGHMYYGTHMEAYESVDNCGTCDGARCDTCSKMYRDSRTGDLTPVEDDDEDDE